ncbi:MAG: ABC transporter permease [Bacteroidota bacterium]|nr:ABC transporter permease [Bacteroidota bacterium]
MRKWSLYGLIAKRYLFSLRKQTAVSILSKISMGALVVSTAAMILLFSVFNGFESLVKNLYATFYPDIKITVTQGKFFSYTPQLLQQIQTTKGIQYLSTCIEDNALVSNGETQIIATVKGIDKQFFNVNNFNKDYIIAGNNELTVTNNTLNPSAIIGNGIANKLGIDVLNNFSSLELIYPNAKTDLLQVQDANAFQRQYVKPDGAFSIQDEFDNAYVLVPLATAQSLMNQEAQISSIEIKISSESDAAFIKKILQKKLGASFTIATRYEQNKTLYGIMQSEKWIVFALLTLILVIASFNLTGALSMLVLEKQKDLSMLRSMGLKGLEIQTIILLEGLLWSFVGCSLGLLMGGLIAWGQQQFGWVKLEGSFIIQSYPVKFVVGDVILIFMTVLSVGAIASLIPAFKSSKLTAPNNLKS